MRSANLRPRWAFGSPIDCQCLLSCLILTRLTAPEPEAKCERTATFDSVHQVLMLQQSHFLSSVKSNMTAAHEVCGVFADERRGVFFEKFRLSNRHWDNWLMSTHTKKFVVLCDVTPCSLVEMYGVVWGKRWRAYRIFVEPAACMLANSYGRFGGD